MLQPDPDREILPAVDDSACLDDDDVLAFAVESSGDPARRARIERHLDICPRCLELVAHVAQDSRSEREDVRSGSVLITTLQTGSTLAERYSIRRFVARGGMGEVYEALDTKLNERVALKTVVSTDGDSARAVRKLFAEVQLARRIQHPHVCRIHELHEHRDANARRPSLHFLTMEFIDGERLGQRIKNRGPLSVEHACHIAGQLLQGLEAAHAANVLHLDFKTDNVMLRKGRTPAHAVIMDFGLSRAVDAEARLRSSEQKELVGSMAYMSPEQVECRRSLGKETDIYAFGVVLFEMLTGRLPFDGDTPVAVMLKRLRERPAAPSRFVPDLPPRLDQFVLRCLSRDLHVRFGDARAARLALERAMSPEPSSARSPLSSRLLLSAAGAVLVALGVAAHLRTGVQAARNVSTEPSTPALAIAALPATSSAALLPAPPPSAAPAPPPSAAPVQASAAARRQPSKARARPPAATARPSSEPARPPQTEPVRRPALPGVPRRLLGPGE
jgi:serine/threonine protein kinase